MKSLTVLLLLAAAVLLRLEMPLAAQANAGSSWKEAPVVIACMHRGSVTFLALNHLPNRQDPRLAKCIALAGPTRPCSELKSYRDGSDIYFGAPADGAGWTKFGRSGYRKMMYMGEPAELNSFQQFGEPWACVVDGALYQEINGVAWGLAAIEWREIMGENGRKRRAMMCQRTGPQGNWSFSGEDGKVFLQANTGTITQIGWMAWRVAPMPDGKKALMLMSKGMGKNARWLGKLDGKYYVEKE